jgi:hypothetical protein
MPAVDPGDGASGSSVTMVAVRVVRKSVRGDSRHVTVEVTDAAGFNLDLDGRVDDAKVVFEHGGDCPLDPLSFEGALLAHPDVEAACRHAGGDGPNVQVVDIEDARNLADRLYYLRHLQPVRDRLHEYADGLG